MRSITTFLNTSKTPNPANSLAGFESILVEMAGIEPASKKLNRKHLQA